MWPDFWDRFMRIDTRAYRAKGWKASHGKAAVLHAGPGAQQWFTEFGLGEDPFMERLDRDGVNVTTPGIAGKDIGSVAMIAAQKLYQQVLDPDQPTSHETRIRKLETELATQGAE